MNQFCEITPELRRLAAKSAECSKIDPELYTRYDVERFLVEQGSQVTADLLLVRPVLEIGLHIVEHAHHLDVGTAVLGTFEGT